MTVTAMIRPPYDDLHANVVSRNIALLCWHVLHTHLLVILQDRLEPGRYNFMAHQEFL
jgi:hypothetical protein